MAGFSSTLQTDAFTGFDALFADGQVVEAACGAHARRKYYEIQKGQDEMHGMLGELGATANRGAVPIEKDIRVKLAEERRR